MPFARSGIPTHSVSGFEDGSYRVAPVYVNFDRGFRGSCLIRGGGTLLPGLWPVYGTVLGERPDRAFGGINTYAYVRANPMVLQIRWA